MLTLLFLLAATVGLALRLLTKQFWLSFCIVGWVYFAIAFADTSVTRVPLNLPATRLAYDVWTYSNDDKQVVIDALFRSYESPDYSHYKALATGSRIPSLFLLQDVVTFYYLLDTLQCLFTLVFAAIAGGIASLCAYKRATMPEDR